MHQLSLGADDVEDDAENGRDVRVIQLGGVRPEELERDERQRRTRQAESDGGAPAHASGYESAPR